MPSVQIGQKLAGPADEIYTISDFLGRGAFGEVYRAVSDVSGNVMAVKLLAIGEMADESTRRALLNEMKAAKEISHRNVVQVLHVNEGGSSTIGPYVCMEYVSGGNLAAVIRAQKKANTKIPLTRALEMMIDIAQGLRAVNTKLVHRDVKPDNILIEGTALKIADFGIAKFIDESTRSHTFKGGQHIAYMAPEGWVAEKNTFKIDVYAAGIVFFEILSLEHPFIAGIKDLGNFLEWERSHLFDSCPDVRKLRSEAPIAMVQLITRMTAKRPQDRPDWDDVLQVLSNPTLETSAETNGTIAPALEAAIASAVAKKQKQERMSLENAQQLADQARFVGLYKRVCEDLLQRFIQPVEQFNRSFQFGQITIAEDTSTGFSLARYCIPTGSQITICFFPPKQNGIAVKGRVVAGGGWIGIEGGRSANLVRFLDGPDDLYGSWSICEIKIMALTDPRKLIGSFGITPDTIEPLGFKNSDDFYQQIYYANGGLHVFTYSFLSDIEDYFSRLIAEGCK